MKRLVLAFTLLLTAPAAAVPIPGPLDGPLPRFTGSAVAPQPLRVPTSDPSSPFPGPLGRGTTRSSALTLGGCARLAFDAQGRLLGVCIGPLGPTLRRFDPRTLAEQGSLTLPSRVSADRTDLGGGAHFLARDDGSLLIPTNARTLIEVDGNLRQTRTIDLRGFMGATERPYAVAAGFDGRDWVVGSGGTVVTVPRGGGELRATFLKAPVTEELATDPSGTYVVTRDALYRLRASPDGTPHVVWRHAVLRAGTPPAIVARRYVAVADAMTPPRVRVVRINSSAAKRLACAVTVFPSAGLVTAPLVVAGQSLVVSNGHGYANVMTTEGGRTSTGGLTRVVVGKRGCRTAWTSREISPSAKPVISRATGLLYTLVKPRSFPDAWNLAAIDWRTGATRFAALAGEGLGFNSEGGAVVLGRDGAAYAGTFGGVVRIRDT